MGLLMQGSGEPTDAEESCGFLRGEWVWVDVFGAFLKQKMTEKAEIQALGRVERRSVLALLDGLDWHHIL